MKRLALVTGASKGLGKEIAISLSRKFKVGIHYFSGRERAEKILKELKNMGGEGEILWGDLSKESGVRNFVFEVKDKLGNPDILVNNFGPVTFKNLMDIELEEWQYIFQTNFFTPLILIKEFLPSMRDRRWGRIINIGFSESLRPKAFKEIVPYSIAKNALLTLTLSVSKMEKDSGITCNMISPYILQEGIFPERKKKVVRTPFHKISSLVLYLCEDDAGNITGKNFIIKD